MKANIQIPTLEPVSSGGVAFRRGAGGEAEVAVVSTLPTERWQLPKGIVDEGESPEEAALREVREEAGIETELVAPIETIEYWYVGGGGGGRRVRYHKFVHFFLLAYRGGDVSDHDHEVSEARWVGIDEALKMLAFKNERAVMEKARGMIADLLKRREGNLMKREKENSSPRNDRGEGDRGDVVESAGETTAAALITGPAADKPVGAGTMVEVSEESGKDGKAGG